MESIKRIFGLLKPYPGKLITGIIVTFLLVLPGIATPYVTKYLVDDVIQGGSEGGAVSGIVGFFVRLTGGSGIYAFLLGAIVLWLSLSVIRAVSVYTRSITFEKVSQNVVFDLRQNLFDHLHCLPFKFYDNHRIGEIMSRMTGDMESVRMLIANAMPIILEHSIYLVGSLIAMFTLDYRLALITLAVAPFVLWLSYRFNKVARPQQTRIREQIAVLNTRTQENISGVRVVKAFAREDHEMAEFAGQNRKHLGVGIEITRTMADYGAIMDFIGSLPAPLMLLVGGQLAIGGQLTTGTLVAAIGFIWMIMMPLRNISNLINMFTQAISSGDRLFYYLDFGSEIREKPDAVFPEHFEGRVTFENVTLRYEDEPALKNISFDVLPGHTLAVMGATGSGKTSIVNLLSRFYDCNEGAVKIDGIDVKDLKLKELRRKIGYVMQETFLFSETLENNIAFGRPDATEEELDRAAAAASATEYISKLDDGYQTIVGERGMGLSGGQKQRAAIARALCYNPAILVLDDATASVDMETEFDIQQALKNNAGKQTTFVISHRISAVKDADEIIVLDRGVIAERGTHFELLKKRGLYFNIFMDQYKDYETISGERLVMG